MFLSICSVYIIWIMYSYSFTSLLKKHFAQSVFQIVATYKVMPRAHCWVQHREQRMKKSSREVETFSQWGINAITVYGSPHLRMACSHVKSSTSTWRAWGPPDLPFTVQTSRVTTGVKLPRITLSSSLSDETFFAASSNTLMHSIYSWGRRGDNGSAACAWAGEGGGLFWIGRTHGESVGGPVEMPRWWMRQKLLCSPEFGEEEF